MAFAEQRVARVQRRTAEAFRASLKAQDTGAATGGARNVEAIREAAKGLPGDPVTDDGYVQAKVRDENAAGTPRTACGFARSTRGTWPGTARHRQARRGRAWAGRDREERTSALAAAHPQRG
jgi:hypothetical protein